MRAREFLGALTGAAVLLLGSASPAAAELACTRVPQLAAEFLHAHVAEKRLTPAGIVSV